MSENSKIEWCDHTFNPFVGCTKISPACDHCYAESWAKRSGQVVWGGERKRTSIANWNLPRAWDRHTARKKLAWEAAVDRVFGGDEAACLALGNIKPVNPKVFCASLADVFDNKIPAQWRMDLFDLISDTPNLTWLILTKRIGNVMSMCSGDGLMFDMISQRVWLGATICNQTEADRDIPKLLSTPAYKRFLSMEPLLGPVDLTVIGRHANGSRNINALSGAETRGILAMSSSEGSSMVSTTFGGPRIDWVIVGGESGPNARPMHPDWVRSLRDQCDSAGVPFLFKQWGEWAPHQTILGGDEGGDVRSGHVRYLQGDGREPDGHFRRGDAAVARVGKKAAGRLLDGREWNGAPPT